MGNIVTELSLILSWFILEQCLTQWVYHTFQNCWYTTADVLTPSSQNGCLSLHRNSLPIKPSQKSDDDLFGTNSAACFDDVPCILSIFLSKLSSMFQFFLSVNMFLVKIMRVLSQHAFQLLPTTFLRGICGSTFSTSFVSKVKIMRSLNQHAFHLLSSTFLQGICGSIFSKSFIRT